MASERVLILGATSAIAGELARLHAARGDRLHLVGRDVAKLRALAARLEAGAAPRITWAQADLAKLDGCAQVIDESIAALGGLDRALILHGLLGDQLESERKLEVAEEILRVNLLSPIALVIPLANRLEQLRAGRLCVVTSVAGDRGRPRNYTYGAAKGGLNLYLQGVRSRLYGTGARITTIRLGPVDTPMTASHEKNAVFTTAPKAAAAILRAVDRGAREAYVPGFWRLVMLVVRSLPEAIFQRFAFLAGR